MLIPLMMIISCNGEENSESQDKDSVKSDTEKNQTTETVTNKVSEHEADSAETVDPKDDNQLLEITDEHRKMLLAYLKNSYAWMDRDDFKSELIEAQKADDGGRQWMLDNLKRIAMDAGFPNMVMLAEVSERLINTDEECKEWFNKTKELSQKIRSEIISK